MFRMTISLAAETGSRSQYLSATLNYVGCKSLQVTGSRLNLWFARDTQVVKIYTRFVGFLPIIKRNTNNGASTL